MVIILTNEQRAHDLTISVLNRLDLTENHMDAVPMDFFRKYIETYEFLIEQFNSKFNN